MTDKRPPLPAKNPMTDLPPIAKGLLERAVADEDQGRFDSAIERYTEALELSAENPYLLTKRANAKLSLEHYADALTDFDEALRINPEAPVTLRLRAAAREGVGDLDGALDDYRRSAELDPRSARPHSRAGLIHQYRGETGLAKSAFLMALDLDPGDALALQGLEELGQIE